MKFKCLQILAALALTSVTAATALAEECSCVYYLFYPSGNYTFDFFADDPFYGPTCAEHGEALDEHWSELADETKGSVSDPNNAVVDAQVDCWPSFYPDSGGSSSPAP